MATKKLFIIGSGGLGREVLATLKHTSFLSNYASVGFIDDGALEKTINGVPVTGNLEYLSTFSDRCDLILAIGNPILRKKIIHRFKDGNNFDFITFIHPKASIYDSDTVKIGKGCFIAEGAILTTNIIVEDFCFLNINVSLHHDTIIRKNTVIMSGTRITGGAEIGQNSFIGPNFQIAEKRQTAENSILKL